MIVATVVEALLETGATRGGRYPSRWNNAGVRRLPV